MLIDDFGWVITDEGLSDTCDSDELSDGITLEASTTVYPNPVQDYLQVNSLSNASYSLFSVGNPVQNSLLQEGVNTLDLSNLKSGVYFLEIKTTSGTIVKKLLNN